MRLRPSSNEFILGSQEQPLNLSQFASRSKKKSCAPPNGKQFNFSASAREYLAKVANDHVRRHHAAIRARRVLGSGGGGAQRKSPSVGQFAQADDDSAARPGRADSAGAKDEGSDDRRAKENSKRFCIRKD